MKISEPIDFKNVHLLKKYLEAQRFDYQPTRGQRTAYFSVRDEDAYLNKGTYDHRYVSIENDDFFSFVFVRSTTPAPEKPVPWRLYSPTHEHKGCALTKEAYLFFTAEKGRMTPTANLIERGNSENSWLGRVRAVAKNGKFCLEPDMDYCEQTVVCASAREI